MAMERAVKLRVAQATFERLAAREASRGTRALDEVQNEIMAAGLDALDKRDAAPAKKKTKKR